MDLPCSSIVSQPFRRGSFHASHAQIHALATTATPDTLRAVDIVGITLVLVDPDSRNES